jgi:heme exporter protein A
MPEEPGQISFQAENLTKKFDRKLIFQDIGFSLTAGDSLAITGKNGAGKSTLIKILSGTLNQSSGTTNLNINGKPVERRHYYMYAGLVSPYLNLYDEFTGYENLKFISSIRGGHGENTMEKNINAVLEKTGLYERRNDILRIYSSGMKQRLKIAFAILHNPVILLLDEPTGNLDTEGIKLVDEIVNEARRNRILIVATNDNYEKSYCEKEIKINNSSN